MANEEGRRTKNVEDGEDDGSVDVRSVSERKIPSDELIERLRISSLLEIISRGRLRWFGHVERKEDNDWVKACQDLKVPGKVGVGRKRRTWKECVEKDMKVGDWRWRMLRIV